MTTLTLSFGVRSLVIGSPGFTPFNSTEYPRTKAQWLAFGRSNAGTAYAEGPFYDLPHLWQLDFRATVEELETLDQMIEDWLQTKPMIYMTLEDLTVPLKEKPPRTRAIATDTTVTTLADGLLSYYPQWNVKPIAAPIYSGHGVWRSVKLNLEEGEKVLAS